MSSHNSSSMITFYLEVGKFKIISVYIYSIDNGPVKSWFPFAHRYLPTMETFY